MLKFESQFTKNSWAALAAAKYKKTSHFLATFCGFVAFIFNWQPLHQQQPLKIIVITIIITTRTMRYALYAPNTMYQFQFFILSVFIWLLCKSNVPLKIIFLHQLSNPTISEKIFFFVLFFTHRFTKSRSNGW